MWSPTRHPEGEGGAFAFFAEQRNIAAVILDDFLDDGQAESRAVFFPKVTGKRDQSYNLCAGTRSRDGGKAGGGHGLIHGLTLQTFRRRIAPAVSASKPRPSLLLFTLARVVAITLLLLALAKWPYGFYTALRITVCVVTAYGVFVAAQLKQVIWAVVLGIIALLFNPFLAVHLGRELWRVTDVVVAVVLGASFFFLRRRSV